MFENLNVTGTVWGCIKRFLEYKHDDLVHNIEKSISLIIRAGKLLKKK